MSGFIKKSQNKYHLFMFLVENDNIKQHTAILSKSR